MVKSRSWLPTLKRAVEVLRIEGLQSLYFKVLGETIYRRVVLLERSLDEPVSPIDPSLPLTFGLLRKTDIDEVAAFRPETNGAEVYRRLQLGQICFIARHEGRLIHVCWVATGCARIDYLDREILLSPGEAYVFESYTAPDMRGKHIAAARSVFMQQALRQTGYHRTVTVVVPENQAGFRPLEKVGYRRLGVLSTVWVGPWRWDFNGVPRGQKADQPEEKKVNGMISEDNPPHTKDVTACIDE